MKQMDSSQLHRLMQLLQLEQQVRCCETAAALQFLIVNATRSLVPFDQACLLLGSDVEPLRVTALSDTPVVDRTVPFVSWLEKNLNEYDQENPERRNQLHEMPARHWQTEGSDPLQEFSLPHLLWIPVTIPSRAGERVGVLWLAREISWTEKETGLLQHIAGTYGHALQAFSQNIFRRNLRKIFRNRKWSAGIAAALLLLMLLPVRLSVLAPGEIRAESPAVVTAPLSGSISKVWVTPGQWTEQGQPLLQMDTTELQGEMDIAEKEWLKSKTELKTAQQASFSDFQAKTRIAELTTHMHLRESQWRYASQRLERATVTAGMSGLAILNDPESLEGRPVNAGEKILQIADPDRVELQVMLAVQDAVALDAGTEILFFLDIDPTNPIPATLRYSVYEPEITAEQIVAYKIVGDIKTGQSDGIPRIGLRGTAKLYGERVTLFYYLFRKPLTAARQWLGW